MKILGLTDAQFVNTVIRKRSRDVHKGDLGRVLLLCGSRKMAGAAIFAGRAAMRSGSGLVTVCTDLDIFSVIQISVPEVICTTWGDVKSSLDNFDVIAVGPGMGVDVKSREIIETILKVYDKTIVIDADGLNNIAADGKLQMLTRDSKASIIMTPHIGEVGRLLKDELGQRSAKDVDRLELAEMLVSKYNAIVCVKGPGTLVAVPDEGAYTNTTGNPGMATAGSGDVLTGVIASFAGQGLSAADAARAGVFVHGMGGDIAAESLGEYGLMASDIAENIPLAIKKIIY